MFVLLLKTLKILYLRLAFYFCSFFLIFLICTLGFFKIKRYLSTEVYTSVA